MKITYMNVSGEIGGAERSLIDLIASMRRNLPEVELQLITCSEGPFIEAVRALGVEAVLFPLPAGILTVGDSALKYGGGFAALARLVWRGGAAAPAAVLAARRLRGLLMDVQPTLVHTNDNKSHLLAALAGSPGLPLVWHLRDFPGSRRFMGRALRYAASRAAGAIAISDSVRRDARRVLPRLPIEVIHNAIDVALYSPGVADGSRLDELAGLPPAPAGSVRVGLVATFARWKGQLLFLEAASGLQASRLSTPLRFYVVGGPIYRTAGSQFSVAELRARAAELGLDGHVGFIGFQGDTAPVYRALDIVVHASTEPEPFGRTIVEAMSCGRAVAAAGSGGAAELFTHGHDALGFRPGSPEALATAIRRLAEDPGLRVRLGAAARTTALEKFSRERLAPQTVAAYRRMIPRLAREPGG